MKCPFLKLLFLLSAALLSLSSPVLAQTNNVSTSNENLQNAERYQLQLEDYESEFGPFDNRLLEPLASLINIYVELGDFETVTELQTRQLSIMRTTLGFEHPDLIPLVRSMIEVQQVQGNWQAVADHLEHLRFLTAANFGSESEELLRAMENQAQWLLAGFYLGEERRQSDNFLDARAIYRDMHRLAEDIYGEDDPALYPWYYKRAYSLALLVQLLNTEDGFSTEMLRDVVRADGPGRLEHGRRGGVINTNPFVGLRRPLAVLDEDGILGEGYLRQAMGFIDDIRDIAEEQGDLETEAMAHIYRGDFAVLMERGSGRRQYNEAQEKLLAAGIPQTDIANFFSVPMPLPVPQFYARFADLLAYQQAIINEVENQAEDVVHLGTFRAYHENARAVLKPVSTDPLLRIGLPQYQVDLEFNISTRGNASSVDVLDSIPEDNRISREGSRAVREIKFRPAYAGDRAQRARDVRLRYLFAQQ
ncbi:MAG: hypothetical protein OXU30_09430 [Gammaproteobacteria bacterium]|nr:hypothetical protein [Gammaproteobacteria bacterium]